MLNVLAGITIGAISVLLLFNLGILYVERGYEDEESEDEE